MTTQKEKSSCTCGYEKARGKTCKFCPPTHKEEWEKEFDGKFHHSYECPRDKVGDPCTCDYDDFKSFISHQIQKARNDALLEAIEEFDKGFETLHGGGNARRLVIQLREKLRALIK